MDSKRSDACKKKENGEKNEEKFWKKFSIQAPQPRVPHCGARTLRNPITTTVTSTVSSSKNGRRATEKKERNAHAHALRVSFPLSSLLIGGLTGFLYRVFFFHPPGSDGGGNDRYSQSRKWAAPLSK